MKYRLSVSYEMDPDGPAFPRDSQAKAIAIAGECMGRNYSSATKRREMEFNFDSPQAALDARDEFLRAGFRAREVQKIPTD